MTKSSIFGTFQISTDQVYIQNQAPMDSVHIELGHDQIRLDSTETRQKPPHFRAVQLNEFTQWLRETNTPATNQNQENQSQQSIKSQPLARRETSADTERQQKNALLPKSKKILRVDTPVSKQTPPISRPKFKTSNYVADPIDIAKTLKQLKSDGRIIGDMHQFPENSQPSSQSIQQFAWPELTNQLASSSAFSDLATAIQNHSPGIHKLVAVCSSDLGCGATTVSLALARHLAAVGRKILVVDADVENAVLASRVGIQNHGSWIQSISQRRSLTDIIVKDEVSNVALLPLISINQVNWPRKSLKELAKLISSISYEYDAVIFDTGTTSQFIRECESPTNLANLTLLVTQPSDENTASAKRALVSANSANLIIVENFSRSNSIRSKVG